MLNLRNFFEIIEYDKIDSTNDEALRLIQNHKINQKTILFANQQTSGRGKKDAIWSSPNGNIYLSLVFPIFSRDLEKYNSFQNFSLLIGLSLYEVMNFYKNTECEIKIKKPNDILIDGKKVAGILIESIFQNNMHYLIVGIGVNWENAPLETSDYVKKFLRIDKNDFIFHAMMNVDEKVGNSQLYCNIKPIIFPLK